MDYRTIMVSLALDQSNDACLAVAGDLAERFEARVVGIAASDIRPTLYFAEGPYVQRVLEDESDALQKRLLELETEFRASVTKRAKSVVWRSALTSPTPYVTHHSRAADLLVVGARAETIVDPSAAIDPSDLMMQAGRPVIVVPPTVQWLDLRSVLVAWKDTRESRRAVFDALPILAAAKEVTIAEIPERDVERATASSHLQGVAAWLDCHGISVNTIVPETDTGDSTPKQLDSIAAAVGAGAVIAGAYGHSRFREWILGGVTRHLTSESHRSAFLSR